jgi:DEAD/DEAH box helicase domain-containing protein
MCGKTEKEIGKALDVHHKLAFRHFQDDEEANQPDNLISLCPSCHHSLEAKEALI